jgi:hypothetical protein
MRITKAGIDCNANAVAPMLLHKTQMVYGVIGKMQIA